MYTYSKETVEYVCVFAQTFQVPGGVCVIDVHFLQTFSFVVLAFKVKHLLSSN